MVQFYRQLVLEIVLQAPSSNITVFQWVKSIRIWSFRGPYIPAFELNTENTDQKNSESGHFFAHCSLFILQPLLPPVVTNFTYNYPFLWEKHLWKVDAYFCIYDQLIGALKGSKGLKKLILHAGCIPFFP